MTPLPHDTARCVGRTSLTPYSVQCPMRESCKRYLALEDDGARPFTTPVAMWLCQTPEFEMRIRPEVG